MLLKVLSLLWLSFGMPFAQDFSPVWFNHREAHQFVKSAILAANAKRGLVDQLQALVLSKQIMKVSKCYQVDPMVFTALIWRESHFKQQSQSETGAVGLTQLTKTGIREVIERLSLNSIRKRESLRLATARCYPRLLNSIPNELLKIDTIDWKKSIARSPELALIFGAILLKINLKEADYRKALVKYNGDPKVKHQFAQDVMILAGLISSSFKVIPTSNLNNSKFLASIQGF
jgi:hypothetical protein